MKKSLFALLLTMVTLGACSHTAERGTASEEDSHYKASHFDKRSTK